MKKTLVYLLLFVFLFNLAGYYLVFEITRHIARQEMQALLRDNPGRLVVLSSQDLSADRDFRWIKPHEFLFRGMMYDVVTETVKDGITHFICKPDYKESKLYDGFKELTGHRVRLVLANFLGSLFLGPMEFSFQPLSFHELTYPPLAAVLTSAPLPCWSPPPETA